MIGGERFISHARFGARRACRVDGRSLVGPPRGIGGVRFFSDPRAHFQNVRGHPTNGGNGVECCLDEPSPRIGDGSMASLPSSCGVWSERATHWGGVEPGTSVHPQCDEATFVDSASDTNTNGSLGADLPGSCVGEGANPGQGVEDGRVGRRPFRRLRQCRSTRSRSRSPTFPVSVVDTVKSARCAGSGQRGGSASVGHHSSVPGQESFRTLNRFEVLSDQGDSNRKSNASKPQSPNKTICWHMI